jgi:hypothetical protein
MAGLGMNAEAGPAAALPLVLAATLGGAAAGYLLARRSHPG